MEGTMKTIAIACSVAAIALASLAPKQVRSAALRRRKKSGASVKIHSLFCKNFAVCSFSAKT
jgi:hypothetical protein